MNTVVFVLDTNPIFPSSVQFPVCASCSRISCDVICNVIGHFGLRDKTDCVKKEKRMLLVYSFLQVCKNLTFNGRRLFQFSSTEDFFFTRKLRYSIQ